MVEEKDRELFWVIEDEGEEAEGGALAGKEFVEIPPSLRQSLDALLRREVMDLLHQEAVARGDLPPPPATWFDRWPGRVLSIAFQALLGALVGTVAVILVLYLLRSLAHVFT